MWEYRAALPLNAITLTDMIHDGDTVKLLIDLGFDARTEKWIRLAGVSAPEIGQPGGAECRAFTASWLMELAGWTATANTRRRWPLRVVTEVTRTGEPTERTSFSRYVGTIYDGSSSRSLSDALQAFILQHPEWPAGKSV